MFLCQKNSFLKEVETEVSAFELLTPPFDKSLSLPEDCVKEGEALAKVLLQESVFFPEGGGQPDDRGIIRKLGEGSVEGTVSRVLRNGNLAEHYVVVSAAKPLQIGDKVKAEIDWVRRFDHMQQHSGQHLITAVADSMFRFPTTSWWLGSEECNVELDTKDITADQISTIEAEVNAKIRDSVPVNVDVVDLDDPKLKTARGRNLPDDVKGNIRIVTMDGIESNVCCGTHVTNLSQIQVVKLLHVIKKKGKCLLHFVCGNRALNMFSAMFLREQKLTEVLKSSTAELPVAAEKLNVALKNSRKSTTVLSKELAAVVAQQFKANNQNGTEKLWMYHRDNVDLDFGMALLREIGDANDSKVLLITLKTEGNSGCFLLTCKESTLSKDKLQLLGEELCSILDGKGSLQRGNLYQAKVNKINTLKKAQTAAQKFLEGV